MSPTTTHRGITTVSEKTEQILRDRELSVYKTDQRQLVDWLLDKGKNPDAEEGYSESTVQVACYRIDEFHRWVWMEMTHGYTMQIRPEHADRYLQHVTTENYENSYKQGILKALKMFFKYRHHRRGEVDWDPGFNFETSHEVSQDEYLSKEELAALRDAALEYGQIPSYANVSPEERKRWKAYLAQRFGIEKREVTKEDWNRANSWKVASLLWTTLDGGLQPAEVGRVEPSWLDLDDGVLLVPKENDEESGEEWIVALRKHTVRALERWLEERKRYDRYGEGDRLWLTREGNPYQSDSLNYILRRLCEIGNIDTSGRKVTWTTLRKSVGVHLADDGDLSQVTEQLRYQSPRSAVQYGSSVEKRRSVLERME